MKKFYAWIDKLFDQFTYTGKIRFVGAIVVSLCIFCIGGNLLLQQDFFKLYVSKLTGVHQARVMIDILRSSIDIQFRVKELALGKTDSEDLTASITNINHLLEKVTTELSRKQDSFSFIESLQFLDEGKELDLLNNQWKLVSAKSIGEPLNFLESLSNFNERILHNLDNIFTIYRLDQGIEMIIYVVSNLAIDMMPSTQVHILSIATLPFHVKMPAFPDNELFLSPHMRLKALNRNIDNMEFMVLQALNETATTNEIFHIDDLYGILNPYKAAINRFVSAIGSEDENGEDSLTLGKAAIDEGWRIEELLLDNLEHNIQYSLDILNSRKYWTVIITVLGFLAFLTLYLTRIIHHPLDTLKEAAKRLSLGDLTVRVPEVVHDEVGNIGIAFNDMAARWQESVSKAKTVANRLVKASSDVFEIAAKLEGNMMNQEYVIDNMKMQANKIAMTIQSFKALLDEVSTSSRITTLQAENSRLSLAEIERVTRQMGSATTIIVDTLSLIEGQVNRINGVLVTIVSIADQSNILALNTAIRACQTGKSGGGFSVVAGKVGELAEQIAFATMDIEKVIRDIVDYVAQAIRQVEDFASQITEQIEDEKVVHGKFTQKINQTQEQIQTFDGMTDDMEQLFKDTLHIDSMMTGLSKVSSETERSIRDLYADAERLSKRTEDLQTLIGRFRINDG